MVFGLHIHVAVLVADRALAVLNAVRSYLPDLAALAGNAPLHAGRDTGLASLRPEIAGLLPRQGIPPVLGSWDEYAGYLAWGRETATHRRAASTATKAVGRWKSFLRSIRRPRPARSSSFRWPAILCWPPVIKGNKAIGSARRHTSRPARRYGHSFSHSAF